MKWLFSYTFTSLEFFSMFMLGFALFRYKYKNNMKKILIMSAVVGAFSTTLDIFGIGMIIGLPSQMILMVLLMKLYMKKKLWTSSLMAITTYVLYGLIQTSIVFMYHYFHMMTLEDLQPNSRIAYGVQALSVFASISVSSVIKLMNEGFALNLDKKFKISRIKLSNRFFLILMIILFLIYGLVFHLYLNNMNTFYFIELFIFCIISSVLMILLCHKRDKEEAGV